MSALISLIIKFAILRVIIGLGFGILTYGGVTYALNRGIAEIKTGYNSLPSDILNFMAIAGVPEYFGIVLGAVSYVTFIRFMKSIVFIGS